MMNKTFKKRGLMSMVRTTWLLMAAAGIAISAASIAHAADPLTVELDGARILKLDTPASDIVIGNPFIADVTVQDPNRLVILGRSPGVTRLIVMTDGTITMDTQVVVHAKNISAQVSVLAPGGRGRGIEEKEFACSDRCTEVLFTPRLGPVRNRPGGPGGDDGPIPDEPTVDDIPPPSRGGGY
jgi:hypothetical protein